MGMEKITYRLDLRGKVCPYPTIEPRLILAKMAEGEVLGVVTDFYPARQTIPRLMEELGYSCVLVEEG